jgi:hypothetical protein
METSIVVVVVVVEGVVGALALLQDYPSISGASPWWL